MILYYAPRRWEPARRGGELAEAQRLAPATPSSLSRRPGPKWPRTTCFHHRRQVLSNISICAYPISPLSLYLSISLSISLSLYIHIYTHTIYNRFGCRWFSKGQ